MPVQIGAPRESTFEEPVRLLSDCHRRVEMFLRVLVNCAERAQPGSPPPSELATALRYFRESAPKHTADEEESLFPRLARVRAACGPMRRLEADHADAAPQHDLVDRVGMLWLAEGRLDADAFAQFRSAVTDLAAMYHRHIEIEDRELFPLAERVLTADEKREIGREMARRRGPGGQLT
ncbi:MAG TPA: hemerythrin domain-containing protein [Bryobacteraceae bacterium]|nr:hemerythrin domain-containing protein [Bryobacteraceae bacterium]